MHYQQNGMEALISGKVIISAMVTCPWVVFRTVIFYYTFCISLTLCKKSHGFGFFPRDVSHTFISDRYVTLSSFPDKTVVVSH